MKSYEINKTVFKRHAISAAVTFFTGFALYILQELDKITLETVESGAWIGILFAAVRAGVKAIIEIALNKK